MPSINWYSGRVANVTDFQETGGGVSVLVFIRAKNGILIQTLAVNLNVKTNHPEYLGGRLYRGQQVCFQAEGLMETDLVIQDSSGQYPEPLKKYALKGYNPKSLKGLHSGDVIQESQITDAQEKTRQNNFMANAMKWFAESLGAKTPTK